LDCVEAEDVLLHVPTLVVTRGDRGASLYRDGHKPVHQSAFEATVVDPTGAGDALRAGWHAALRDGRSQEEALRWGQAAAAWQVGRIGAQESAMRRADIEQWLAKTARTAG
jgi:sugar/nucleoside kinase (ribokinase family)